MEDIDKVDRAYVVTEMIGEPVQWEPVQPEWDRQGTAGGATE
jgi:hypothetical protein